MDIQNMLRDKPFIHLLNTPYGFYFFDVNTDNIYGVSEDVYETLDKIQKGKAGEEIDVSRETISKIDYMIEQGLLKSKHPKEISNPQVNYLEYYLNRRIRKITLQLTQQCNFRCSYCIYSETDNDMQRKHANNKMTFDTAKKAIDFLFAHSIDEENINIGFYGGEPLLEFELIKKSVEYAEIKCDGKRLTFTITTNGSLLNDEIISYFIAHKVDVMISLDGPKEIHDKNRHFAANGCGTFDVIEKNLMAIKERHPEFYKTIGFSIVIDPRNDYKCLNEAFVNYDLFKSLRVHSSVIDDSYSNEKISYNNSYIINKSYESFKTILCSLNRVDPEKISPIDIQEIGEIEKMAKELGKLKQLPDTATHGGPCIPGQLRLFATVNGDFFPCERVSELSDIMKIGNIHTGFDFEKAKNISNICKLTENSCKQCWAINHCSLCAKSADNKTSFSADLMKTHCNSVRNNFSYYLKEYLLMNEIHKNFENSDIQGINTK